ncbi:nuclear transport factor 2 family protein [Mycobacterium sp. IEC1808]|uniref:nuclear transport factor 2 family protein n=1 Tax=Mycobacterium sp. IEC1808 TaxID=1743230 RepID=UPI001302C2B9|nr:nuclear transport factor 2 family protein [Mycobacterium sp. IEC1808]
MAPEERAAFDLLPSNLARGLVNTDPRIVAAKFRLAGTYATCDLDPQLRELVMMRVAALCDSEYERLQHRDKARAAGLTDPELRAVEAGDQTRLDSRKATVLRFVDECYYRTKVSEPVLTAARDYVSDSDLIAIILIIGSQMQTARFVETFEIDLDDAPANWDALERRPASSGDDDTRAAMLQLVGAYQTLLVEKRWEEWIELWAEDGELFFPFAPLGRKSVYRGRAEILGYMKDVSRVAVDTLDTIRLFPMQDPNAAVIEFSVKGHAPGTGAPYNQSFVLIVEAKGGKIWRYREYWNPLVTIDALGDRETWTEGFGVPDPTRDAWGS